MKNYFETIYQIALNQDEKYLNKLLSEGVGIDEYQQCSYHMSAAAACARDGNFEAAEWLRQHGADVKLIAYGAATGGHKNYAEKLRSQRNATASWIAQGAAFSGYKSYAEFLRKFHNAKVSMIAFGAAMGGYIEYAEFLRTKCEAELREIAAGAAIGGYTKYLDRLLMKYLQYTRNIDYISKNLAYKGDIDSVKDFYSKYEKYGLDFSSIDYGAGFSGDMQFAESIRQLYKADENLIICGAWGAWHLRTEKSIYHFFLTLPVQVQKIYAEPLIEISSIYKQPLRVERIMKKAIHVQNIAKKFQINHSLAECLIRNNNFQIYATWFLQASQSIHLQENRSLPFEIILLISQQITGFDVKNTQEFFKMFERFHFQIKKQEIINALRTLTRTKWRHEFTTTSNLKEQVEKLIHTLSDINDEDVLFELLQTTLQTLNERNNNEKQRWSKQKNQIYKILSIYVNSKQNISAQSIAIKKLNYGE